MRWARGFIAAAGVAFLCLMTDAYYVVSHLGPATAYVRWPYDEPWWAALVCAPVASLTFWRFSRPSRISKFSKIN